MITLSWALLFIVVALVCFGAVAIGFSTAFRRIGLLGAGLFFLTLYLSSPFSFLSRSTGRTMSAIRDSDSGEGRSGSRPSLTASTSSRAATWSTSAGVTGPSRGPRRERCTA